METKLWIDLPSVLTDKISAIYEAYPRKRERANGIRAIAKALKRIYPRDADWLLARTKNFAHEMSGVESCYIPYSATWFNREAYEDDVPKASTWGERQEQMKREFESELIRGREMWDSSPILQRQGPRP